MSDKTEKPWWWPQLVNAEWRTQIRKDYPEDVSGWGDDQIDDTYADGWPYVDLWDHLGDARADWEQLANAFLKLVEETGKKPSDFT